MTEIVRSLESTVSAYSPDFDNDLPRISTTGLMVGESFSGESNPVGRPENAACAACSKMASLTRLSAVPSTKALNVIRALARCLFNVSLCLSAR